MDEKRGVRYLKKIEVKRKQSGEGLGKSRVEEDRTKTGKEMQE